jgi:hypothetical protein
MNNLTQFNKAMQRAVERRSAKPKQIQSDRQDKSADNKPASTNRLNDVEYQSHLLALMKTHIHNKSHQKDINK